MPLTSSSRNLIQGTAGFPTPTWVELLPRTAGAPPLVSRRGGRGLHTASLAVTGWPGSSAPARQMQCPPTCAASVTFPPCRDAVPLHLVPAQPAAAFPCWLPSVSVSTAGQADPCTRMLCPTVCSSPPGLRDPACNQRPCIHRRWSPHQAFYTATTVVSLSSMAAKQHGSSAIIDTSAHMVSQQKLYPHLRSLAAQLLHQPSRLHQGCSAPHRALL